MAGNLQRAGAASCFVHLAGGERRVAIDRLEVIGDVAVRVVVQLVLQASDGALAATDSCTYAPVHGGASIVEPQLIVGVPVGGANPPSEVMRDSRNPVPGVPRIGGERRSNLGGQGAGDPFVGVERQDPVVSGQRRGEVLLRRVACPRPHDDTAW